MNMKRTEKLLKIWRFFQGRRQQLQKEWKEKKKTEYEGVETKS